MLTFVTGHYCPLQSLRNRSSISVSAGSTVVTDFLELYVEQYQLLLNFMNILEMTPSQLKFTLKNKNKSQRATSGN